MKVILIGASGTLGRAIYSEISPRHVVIQAGRKSGDFQVDIADKDSIAAFFEKIGPFDALIAAAGDVHFAPLERMNDALYQKGLQNKLMGQVNLVLMGKNTIKDGGSFTLTSGILSHDPIVTGSSAAMVNGAIDSFVKAAAIELPRGIRINAVSPTIVTESLPIYGAYFHGFNPVPATRAALAYSKSCEGRQTGQIYRAD